MIGYSAHCLNIPSPPWQCRALLGLSTLHPTLNYATNHNFANVGHTPPFGSLNFHWLTECSFMRTHRVIWTWDMVWSVLSDKSLGQQLRCHFIEMKQLYSTLLHLPPLRFNFVRGWRGIEPWTVATLALIQSNALTTQLDLIREMKQLNIYIISEFCKSFSSTIISLSGNPPWRLKKSSAACMSKLKNTHMHAGKVSALWF